MLLFKERTAEEAKERKVVRISGKNYEEIKTISERTKTSFRAVADKLIEFALERVEWKT